LSTAAAQLQFAAEFAVFLVAGAGIALLVLRPGLLVEGLRPRRAVIAGFALLAVAAFTRGALLVEAADEPALVAVRAAGIVVLFPGPLYWRGGPTGRVGLVIALIALAGAEALRAAAPGVGADWASLLGALGIGLACYLAARRSIPTRIAASTTTIVLGVVLAVSVGLSAVLASNVEDEAERRFAAQAATEASLAEGAARTASVNASLVAQVFAQAIEPLRSALSRLALAGDPQEADLRAAVEASLQQLVDNVVADFDENVGPIVVVRPDGTVLAAVVSEDAPLTAAAQGELVGSDLIQEVLTSGRGLEAVITAGDRALAAAAEPVQFPGAATPLSAVVVVTSSLDDAFLVLRSRLDANSDVDGIGYALAGRDGVVAAAGDPGDPAVIAALALPVLDGGDAATRTVDGRQYSVAAVQANDSSPVPVLGFVLSVPTTFIDATRTDLFRLLFLIALAATLAALVLTAVVGERIGVGLRRLTSAVGEVRAGNLGVTTGLRSDDELGVLSVAFDEMTGSLRTMTADLRQAATDESVLRARMEAVVAGMGEALLAVDERGDITDFNAAAEVLCGIPARKAMGRPVDQIVRLIGDDGSDLTPRLTEPVDGGWSASATVVHGSGLEVPVAVSAGALHAADVAIDTEGAPASVGAVYLIRDVRRERDVERMKTELLSNIGHELRTPLTPIKAYAQILRTRPVDTADVARFAGEIEIGADRLNRVVDQLMHFASVAGGRYDLRTEPVVPRDLVEGVITRWRSRLDPERHLLGRRVARGLPKVWIDRRAIDRALDELIDNALKYSPQGGRVEIRATVGVDPARGPVVRISVTDHGVGIAPDRLEALFEAFIQGDGSATRAFGGLGLGLALVTRIAEAHGGELDVRTELGTGSRFTVVLPATEPVASR
jgi:two-component system sensor histidine kinase VicK